MSEDEIRVLVKALRLNMLEAESGEATAQTHADIDTLALGLFEGALVNLARIADAVETSARLALDAERRRVEGL